ncbi:chemotaxis protein CheW [Anaeromyxobacter oryzisoli]|jgi:purine-binding chemotaxis protein CheW|uniref:chemotaxis protein CheW n=1 Tax=Anaeromyxobacter oryzisoli TaxID=2925408 RepID=UPI001F56BC18|nr:chemotaxis protein CheW [Anaeromyxobacter sp. SG63]
MAQNTTTTDTERAQHLSFSLGGCEYGVGILKVKEILQYEEITRVPSTPRSVRGVINLRGAVVPVIDLAAKFGLPETAVTRLTCILIVEAVMDGQPTVVGVMADAVREVIELGPADIEPTPTFGTQVRVDFLLGMGKVGKRFVLLLDIDRVISADEREFAQAVKDGLPEDAAEPAPEPAGAAAASEAAAPGAAEPQAAPEAAPAA